MKDLIEALTIFAKYKDWEWPTHCEHDVLTIMGITEEEVSKEDRERLNKLGFLWGDEAWISFRFGSA
jgi:hypothetical protein